MEPDGTKSGTYIAATGSLFGLDATPDTRLRGTAVSWDAPPLTLDVLVEALSLCERDAKRERTDPPLLVPHATWQRMEAVRREFPNAPEWDVLAAAWCAEDDAEAIRYFAERAGLTAP